MPTALFQYEMLPTTWFYVSALMILAIFFRFNRLLSIRNFDLIGVILLGLGLLFFAMDHLQTAFCWIFGLQTLFIFRLFYDTVIVRRPLLEPNLTPSGLRFACIMLLGFMIANLVVNRGEQVDSLRTTRLEQLLTLKKDEQPEEAKRQWNEIPGYRPFFTFVESTNRLVAASPKLLLQSQQQAKESESGLNNTFDPTTTVMFDSPLITPPYAETSPTLPSTIQVVLTSGVIALTHIMIVLALIYIGHCHFGNMQTGTAAATVYLLLPYTNQMLARMDVFIPIALILWAVAFYRRPFFAGTFIGIAANLVFYPLFLIPLWGSFYWKRGYTRFVLGLALTYCVFLNLLFWNTANYHIFGNQVANLFGKNSFLPDDPCGVWAIWDPIYRIPLLALFVVTCLGMILWPSRKHLGVLISCSTLMMIGVQFWQPYEGGLYMGWYLPLLLLVIFRPNLEDCVASTTVLERRYFF